MTMYDFKNTAFATPLEKFGKTDLQELADLIKAYALAGQTDPADPAIAYTILPPYWTSDNVAVFKHDKLDYPCLINDADDFLTITDYGVMFVYHFRYFPSGTALDIADEMDNILDYTTNSIDFVERYCQDDLERILEILTTSKEYFLDHPHHDKAKTQLTKVINRIGLYYGDYFYWHDMTDGGLNREANIEYWRERKRRTY